MEATLDSLQKLVAEESHAEAVCGWLTERQCGGGISCWSSTYAAPTE